MNRKCIIALDTQHLIFLIWFQLLNWSELLPVYVSVINLHYITVSTHYYKNFIHKKVRSGRVAEVGAGSGYDVVLSSALISGP